MFLLAGVLDVPDEQFLEGGILLGLLFLLERVTSNGDGPPDFRHAAAGSIEAYRRKAPNRLAAHLAVHPGVERERLDAGICHPQA
ncbi:hypothetical protein D3C87_2052950 [compost metagenome]